ncbi:NfeD family protein [Herminiimonas sp. CN]|uniref:NfeD family protein n=1 Tax=Herminiimonas sp. CN TaxID=1349818 RepID=UPI000473E211|nr:NfeD family protein [Herminiimonas sp. CN]
MHDWMIWFGMAGILVIAEIFTGTFYLLMIALGMLAGGAAALTGVAFALQMTLAAIMGAIATFLLRKSSFARKHKVPAARDPNVNLDIGQTVDVAQWHGNHARAMYRGAMWDIELMPGAVAVTGTFVIREIRGSHLIVANTAS